MTGNPSPKTGVPSAGERAAVVGYSGQYRLAARIVHARLPELEWIRVADPSAGAADDFQFKAGTRRHALQVKWSEHPSTFTWGDLVNSKDSKPALLTQLARAWQRLRQGWRGPLTVHLCTNNFPSPSPPRSGSSMDSVSADSPHHFAAFMSRAFEPVRRYLADSHAGWSELQELPEFTQWLARWSEIKRASKLGDEQFTEFLHDFSFSSVPDDKFALTQRDMEADSDVTRLAAELQAIVANPERQVQISRDQLLRQLDWTDRLQYRHRHRFPVPEIYTANSAARSALEGRLVELPGGYVALVGPAGSGKSTLLESIGPPGTVVRYYAFVPDSPDPLSGRGEADSFLHDVSLALEDSGIRRQGYGNDVIGRQSILMKQLEQAGLRYAARGEQTIIVVDGLDHISREQNPSRSLLDELPLPVALPVGVYIVLGSQTLDGLPPPIQRMLGSDGRTVQLPPLSNDEVRHIADRAGVSTWLLPSQIHALVTTSEGHPLALTYLLQELSKLEGSELDARPQLVDSVLSDASRYGGDISQRYDGYLAAVGDDAPVRQLLGIVSRMRVPVDLEWLATWVEPDVLETFVVKTSAFFRRRESQWRFVHNSFRRFLVDQTSSVVGSANTRRNQQIHSELADRYAAADGWPLYQDQELTHRFLAGQYKLVLDGATPQRLRTALCDMSPTETVRRHAYLAIRSAAEIENYSALVRMLLFISEVAQREFALQPKDLATTVMSAFPDAALEHVVQGGSLRLDTETALGFAAEFAASGDDLSAGEVVHAAGGLSGLVDQLKNPGAPGTEWAHSVADWAEVTWYRSGLDRVIDELDRLLPLPPATPIGSGEAAPAEVTESPGNDGQPDWRKRSGEQSRSQEIAYARSLVHARCFDLANHLGDEDQQVRLAGIIDSEAEVTWRARVRLMRCSSALSDDNSAEVLRQVKEMLNLEQTADPDLVVDHDEEDRPPASPKVRSLPLSLRIQAAELLIRAGHGDTPYIDALLPPGTQATWPSSSDYHSQGLRPFEPFLDLARLRWLRPDRSDALTPGESKDSTDRRAGNRRLQRALLTLAHLEGQALAASLGKGKRPSIAGSADPVVRLLEVPLIQTHDWTGFGPIRDAAPDLFRRLVFLSMSVGGPEDLQKLLVQFERAWTTPERSEYWPPSRQQVIVSAALDANPELRDWAIAQLSRLDTEIADRAIDPEDLTSTWLTQAERWAQVDDLIRARLALRSAVLGSWGPGQNEHDRQLVGWLDWMVTAADQEVIDSTEFLAECRSYASRLSAANVVSSSQASEAAEHLIRVAFERDPALTCALAEALCEHGVLTEAMTAEAVVTAAAHDLRVNPVFVAEVFANLLMPIKEGIQDYARIALSQREDQGELSDLLDNAERLWSIDRFERSPSSHEDTTPGLIERAESALDSAPTAVALLATMRNLLPNQLSETQLVQLEEDAERLRGHTSRIIARALIDESRRLGLGGPALGAIAALAAEAGEADRAEAALNYELARTPATAWSHHWEGGARLNLFRSALHGQHPSLVHLAARDFAGAVSSGAIQDQIDPADLLRFAELIGGSALVASAWPDIHSQLDEYAPSGSDILPTEPLTNSSPTGSLLHWSFTYLGHPVRPLDFGARKIAQVALRLNSDEIHLALNEAIAAGGWRSEAALLALITMPGFPELPLSPHLHESINRAACGSDAINRSLAVRLLQSSGVTVQKAPMRTLPAAYQLSVPPLPPRSVPELDAKGIPHIDPHDPQQLVAPFDVSLKRVAARADLEQSTVMHRAATIASRESDPWITGGHRAQADRLQRRGQKHSYRPWAFMAGRRALGTVLGELVDAQLLPLVRSVDELGLIDEVLFQVEPRPLDATTPMPWRRPGTADYDTRGWCEETKEAAEVYSERYPASPYVLAEFGEWYALEWGRPEEERKLLTSHQDGVETLAAPQPSPWEVTQSGAMSYPEDMLLTWEAEELVIHGYEQQSDAISFKWLALHPHVARQLDWEPDDGVPFGWNGLDGKWRARSIRKVRGLLSHRPPHHTYCAEVWQVVLSSAGRNELLDRFPGVIRALHIKRTLPRDKRESRPEDEQASARALLSTH